MRLPPRPLLAWTDDDSPRSLDVDDVYFAGDGLAEKRAVFVGGCGLPERWRGRSHFTIGELGFGAGLAFLAAWDTWRRHRPAPEARLDFLSFESAPMSAEDAARVQARWPEVADLSTELIANWPHRARGPQRIALSHGVSLTLIVGEISETLPRARASVDAWFLDGFSPAKNPQMWAPETLAMVARLSAKNARAATYSVAGDVRRALEAAGFDVRKAPNIGRKKERLEASLLSGGLAPPPSPRRVAIIGAGVAGALAAKAFSERGAEVTVFDAADEVGAGASGNPLALVMPRLDADDGPVARALVTAWLTAHRTWTRLSRGVAEVDVAHLPRDEGQARRFANLLKDPPLDETFLAELSGSAGLLHRRALAIRTTQALSSLLAGSTLRLGASVVKIAEAGAGAQMLLADGSSFDADHVVVCTGMGFADIGGLSPPHLTGRLGQVEATARDGAHFARADGGYVVAAHQLLCFGATFENADGPAATSDHARAENLRTLARLAPEMMGGELNLLSRASIRATTQDRLPIAGAAPLQGLDDHGLPRTSPTISLIGGLGARGYLWAPVLAELLASSAYGEPAPLDADAVEALSPLRFARRALRRGH